MIWHPIDDEQREQLMEVMKGMTGVDDGFFQTGPNSKKTIGQLFMMLNERLTRAETQLSVRQWVDATEHLPEWNTTVEVYWRSTARAAAPEAEQNGYSVGYFFLTRSMVHFVYDGRSVQAAFNLGGGLQRCITHWRPVGPRP